MKALFFRSAAVVLAAALAGCTALGAGGASSAGAVDVTRNHLSQPIARTQIAVEPIDAADRNTPEFPAYRAAVERQLTRLGWTVVSTVGTSEQIALMDVEQGSRAALEQGAPVAATAMLATQLEVSLRRRSHGSVIWGGKALTEGRAGTPAADRAAVSEKLATALFRDFPGESGRTIRVR